MHLAVYGVHRGPDPPISGDLRRSYVLRSPPETAADMGGLMYAGLCPLDDLRLFRDCGEGSQPGV